MVHTGISAQAMASWWVKVGRCCCGWAELSADVRCTYSTLAVVARSVSQGRLKRIICADEGQYKCCDSRWMDGGVWWGACGAVGDTEEGIGDPELS
jgi:hypothetical protein